MDRFIWFSKLVIGRIAVLAIGILHKDFEIKFEMTRN